MFETIVGANGRERSPPCTRAMNPRQRDGKANEPRRGRRTQGTETPPCRCILQVFALGK
jgi:hypothetical protein